MLQKSISTEITTEQLREAETQQTAQALKSTGGVIPRFMLAVWESSAEEVQRWVAESALVLQQAPDDSLLSRVNQVPVQCAERWKKTVIKWLDTFPPASSLFAILVSVCSSQV